jgi:site-specific DNA-methyltransferase (adenine-specific)
VWGGNYFCNNLPESQGWIVWDKKHPDGVKFADCELAWTSFNVATRIFRFMWNGMLQEDMKNKEYKIHPKQKPVRLYEWILQNYAKDGDVILDTHVGSASSLVACHNLRFDFVGFELDPIYYEKAKQRLEAEKAQLTIFDCFEQL